MVRCCEPQRGGAVDAAIHRPPTLLGPGTRLVRCLCLTAFHLSPAFAAVFHDHVCARGFFWCRAFYRTSDDKLFYFTLQAVNDWPVLCETIDRPELATDPRAHDRLEQLETLHVTLCGFCRVRDAGAAS